MPVDPTWYSKMIKREVRLFRSHVKSYWDDPVPSLTDEETEAQRGKNTMCSSHTANAKQTCLLFQGLPRCYIRAAKAASSVCADCFRRHIPWGPWSHPSWCWFCMCRMSPWCWEQKRCFVPSVASLPTSPSPGDLEFRIQILSSPKELGQHSLINNEVQLHQIFFWSCLNARCL